MAHVEKYTIGAVGHMFKHYERAKDDKGEYIKFGNQNIDLTKTGTNYNMATEQKLPQLAFINKRLKEVKVQQRADVNVMCSWIVTLPQGVEPDEKQFFIEVFKFLSERYGKENVVSAYIHRDESQPHMHFSFIPVVADKKKKRLKVSAKELLNRQELQCFHEDLEKYLYGVFGKDMGVRNDATKLGNKTVRELKMQTALEEQQTVIAQTKAKKIELQRISKDIEGLKVGNRITAIKIKKNEVVISKEDYDRANQAMDYKYYYEGKATKAEEKARFAEIEKEQAVRRMPESEIRELNKRIIDLYDKNNSLARAHKKSSADLSLIKAILAENPQLNAEYLRALKLYLKEHPELQNQSELE